MNSTEIPEDALAPVRASPTVEQRDRQPAAGTAWNWMDDMLDASFPASDPPSFSPTRIGKPPRR